MSWGAVAAAAPAPADPPGQAASGTQLQEVLVTAEKRETNLQRTPDPIRAVSYGDLVRAGATELSDIGKVMPDVKITRVNQGAVVDIRGVSSAANNPTSDAAVAVEVNGADLAKQQALQGFLFDLQRIEVLKGPQGTLYGRNSNGGTINIITAKPSLGGMSAEAEVEYGSYDLLRAEGSVNLPLGDDLALRAAFQTIGRKGYMKSGLDDENEQSGRLSLLWKPTDRLSFSVVGDYYRDASISDLATFNITAKQPGVNIYVPSNPRDDTFYDTVPGAKGVQPFHRNAIMQGVTAQADYDLGFATWTTVAAYRDFNSNAMTPNNIGQGAPTLAPDGKIYPGGARSFVPMSYRSESLESRLGSTSFKSLQWVAGLYLFRETDSGTQVGYADLTTTTPAIEIANPYELTQSAAVFGQFTYTPPGLDRLHLTLGGRLNLDNKEVKGIFTRIGTTPFPYNSYLPEASHTWRAATYKAGGSYDLTDKSLVYADVSTGFKSGGYGYGPGINPKQGPIYAPETITAYEIGSKNRFLDNRLQINLEAWYYDYGNFQTNLIMYACSPVCGGIPVLTVASAGQATYKGAEIGGEYQITDHDLLKTTFTAISARYDTYVTQAPAGFSLVPTRTRTPVLADSISGTDIPGVPRWSGVISYSHTFDVFGGTLQPQFDAQLRGPVLLNLTDDPVYGRVLTSDHAWIMGDVSLRYTPIGRAWSLTAYVRNVADALHPVAARYSAQIHAWNEAFFPPRTIGVIFIANVR
ncbi:MAG TPA: TonB-dependent receptor [Caulobacteraceae bacterium]|jgi:iron complex outermembrane receptor protein|nr:TonB-dependent receptor [Caulobacteraceae bacterium]